MPPSASAFFWELGEERERGEGGDGKVQPAIKPSLSAELRFMRAAGRNSRGLSLSPSPFIWRICALPLPRGASFLLPAAQLHSCGLDIAKFAGKCHFFHA